MKNSRLKPAYPEHTKKTRWVLPSLSLKVKLLISYTLCLWPIQGRWITVSFLLKSLQASAVNNFLQCLQKKERLATENRTFFLKPNNTKFLVRWNNWEINLTLMKKTNLNVGWRVKSGGSGHKLCRQTHILFILLRHILAIHLNAWKIFPVAHLRSKDSTFNCFEMYWKTIHSAAIVSITWILAIFSHRNFWFGVFCTQKHFT